LRQNSTILCFNRAVQLFQGWGFRVQEGPGEEEVTLILEGPAHCSYHVFEAVLLPQMASAILNARWRSGCIIAPAGKA
jgi:hypothetical protein